MTEHNRLTLKPCDWTENELLTRMLAKDEQAWREFHLRYEKLVFHCIQKAVRKFRGDMSSEDIQDMFASFMLSLTLDDMKKLRKFCPERGNRLSTWVGVLANHSAWDFMRATAKHTRSARMSELPPLPSGDVMPNEITGQREELQVVQESVQHLSDKDQELMHMHFLEGCSAEQIASQMQISVKTVYSKKHKIRERLKKDFQEQAEYAVWS